MLGELKMLMMLIFPKCCNVSFGQTLFQIYDQNSWPMTSSKTFVTLDLSSFLFGTKNLTLILQFEPSIDHFFKNLGNDVANNDDNNFKVFF